jgi:hypothetical protein
MTCISSAKWKADGQEAKCSVTRIHPFAVNALPGLLDVAEAASGHVCFSTADTTSGEGTAFCPLCVALSRLASPGGAE